MSQANSKSQEEWDLWVENAVFEEIIRLHPAHLTPDELAVRMEDANTNGVAVTDAIRALRHSGLVRLTGEVIEPTYAALRAFALLTR